MNNIVHAIPASIYLNDIKSAKDDPENKNPNINKGKIDFFGIFSDFLFINFIQKAYIKTAIAYL